MPTTAPIARYAYSDTVVTPIYLSNRVFEDYQHLLDAGAEAWQQLTQELLRSIWSRTYLTHEKEG